MKCVLHIGTEKTGTSLIQDWLYSNQDALSSQGVFLSNILEKTNNRRIVAYFQDKFDDWHYKNFIDNDEKRISYFEGFEENFHREVESAKNNHHTIIITSEHFHSRLRDENQIISLKIFLEGIFDDVRIVCYFREQSGMSRSRYSTAVKMSLTDKLSDFRNNVSESDYYYNFYEIASLWSSVFGAENCLFRIYDRKRFRDGDIRKDFIDSLFFPLVESAISFAVTSSNESLSFLEAELYREINEQVPYWNAGLRGLNHENIRLKGIISEGNELKIGSISGNGDAEVSQRFERSNKAFFDHFFDGIRQFERPEDPNAEDGDKLQFTLDDLAAICRELLTRMIANYVKMERSLLDGDADHLRDIALKYEKQETLSLDDAIVLMTLARRARPNGPLINEKLKYFTDLANEKK